MNNLFANFGQKIIVIGMVLVSIFTTGTAIAKVSSRTTNIENNKTLETNIEEPFPNETGIPEMITETPSISPTAALTPKITAKPTAFPTALTTPKPTVAINNTSGKCVVTLFGKLFDVTQLKNTHSGGNIFVCNSDMTSTYSGKHGTSLSRMAGYEINANGSPVSTITPNPKEDEPEDDD